jgi:autotransporter-associated beta strand protein
MLRPNWARVGRGELLRLFGFGGNFVSAIGYRAELRIFVTSFFYRLQDLLTWRSLGLAGVLTLGMMSWLSLNCHSASAAAYTWDPSESMSVFGGGGTWDPSSSNWWDGTMTTIWSSGNDAWFTGPNPGGTVTLDAPQTVGNIVFSQTGYTLTGSTLTVSGGTITANQNATINSSIADNSSGVTITGAHVLTLGAGANTGLTGIVTVSSGTVNVNGANKIGGGLGAASSIVINSGATVATNQNGVSNSLIGQLGNASQSIQINAGGLLTYPVSNGSTDHLNALNMGGGTLFAVAPNATYGTWNFDGGVSTAGSGNTSYMIGGNAALTQSFGGGTQFNVNTGDVLYVATQLFAAPGLTGTATGNGNFPLVIGGAGTLILAGSNNFSTSTQMNSGTLVLANTAALLNSPLVLNAGSVTFNGITQPVPLVSLAGNFSGTLVLANTNGSPVNVSVGGGGASSTYSGLVTGGGSLTVAGGHLMLGGANNHNATILNGGILTLGNPAAAGTGTITFYLSGGTVSGGTLQYTSAANGVDLSPQFSAAGSQKFNIDTNGQDVSFGTLNTPCLKGSGGVLDKFGGGLLLLNGSNGYSGGTRIDGGLLQFANGLSVPKFGTININVGGALVASSGSATTVNGWLTVKNGLISGSSSGAMALTSSSADTNVNFTLGSGYPNLSLGAVGTVTYAGTINPGSGGYNLGGGGGTLWVTTQLTGTNSLTVGNGGGGTVILTNSGDNWGGATAIVPGATLQLGDGMASLVSPTGAITNNGTLILPNAPSLPQTFAAGISGTGALYAFGSSVLTLNGTNSTGIFYANGGTVNINGSFSSTGKTVFGTNLAIAPPTPVVVNWSATGSMNPSTGGAFVGIADTGGTATLNINGGSLAINSNAAGVNLFVGNGASGKPATGTLNINAGIVTLGAAGAVDIGGIGAGNDSGTGTINVSSGLLSIPSGGTNAAPGGNNAITMGLGSNSTAAINLNGGMLATGRSFVFGNGVGSSGTLDLNGGTLQGTATNGNWFQGITVMADTGGAFIDIPGNNSLTVASTATISGPGSLTKSGSGNLALNGTNPYQGNTVVNGGTLSVVSEAGLGVVPSSFVANNITLNGGELRDNSGSVMLSLSPNRGVLLGPSGGYLRCGFTNTMPINGIISGGGNLTIVDDTGSVYLANPGNTYSGSTTIGLGPPLGYTNGSATVNVQMLVNGGLPSSIGASTSNASNLVFSAPSNGTGKLNYVGSGDSTDRLFTIVSGTAAINSSGAGPLNFTNAGAIVFANALPSTLALGGTYAGPTSNTFAPQITDYGAQPTTVAINGSLWTLTGTNNTYSSTVLNGGTLNVINNNELQSSVVTVNSGNLAFATGVTSPAVAGLSGNGSGVVLQNASSNPVTLFLGANGASSTFSGNLSGPGGLVKTGSGRFVLSASQSYGGATAINGGTLQILPSLMSVNSFGGSGAGWTFNKSSSAAPGVGVANNVFTATVSGTGNTSTSLWYNTPLNLAGVPWTAKFTYNDVSGNGADGVVFALQNASAGTAALTSGGGNLMGFSGISPSAGLTLQIFNASEVNFVTNPTGSLENIGQATSPVNLRATNSPVNFTVRFDGNSTLTMSATQGANTVSGTWSANLYNVLGGAGASLANALAYIGFTGGDGGTTATQTISNFSVTTTPASVDMLPANTALQVGANGVLDLNGGSQEVGSLAGSGQVVTTAGASYLAALTLGNDNSNQTFSGTIAGNLALTKVGAGSETLSGTNTFTGVTTVAGGTLVVTNNEGLADGSNLIVGNASYFPAAVVPSPPVSVGAAVVPVPEPSALAVLAAGSLAAGFAAWRRRRR